jgi:hypothetical protein
MKNVKNRRGQARVPFECDIRFQRSVLQRDGCLKSVSGQGTLQNLSDGGICLTTDSPLSVKQFLALSIPAPVPGVAIPTLALVRWTRQIRGKGKYAAGLSFLY